MITDSQSTKPHSTNTKPTNRFCVWTNWIRGFGVCAFMVCRFGVSRFRLCEFIICEFGICAFIVCGFGVCLWFIRIVAQNLLGHERWRFSRLEKFM